MAATQEEQDLGIAGLMYYLYRQEGSVFGNNLAGFNKWKRINIDEPWEILSTEAYAPK
jgi:hypothetical protein